MYFFITSILPTYWAQLHTRIPYSHPSTLRWHACSYGILFPGDPVGSGRAGLALYGRYENMAHGSSDHRTARPVQVRKMMSFKVYFKFKKTVVLYTKFKYL